MRAIALTGAGISVAAGIPTFQEMPWIRDKLTVEYRLRDEKDFLKVMEDLRLVVSGKSFTKAHKLLADWHIPVITMNIDRLHTLAGSNVVYELHGNIDDGVVLYGEPVHCLKESKELIRRTAKWCLSMDSVCTLLVIGTSLQVNDACMLVDYAKKCGCDIIRIDKDADSEVEKILEWLGKNRNIPLPIRR